LTLLLLLLLLLLLSLVDLTLLALLLLLACLLDSASHKHPHGSCPLKHPAPTHKQQHAWWVTRYQFSTPTESEAQLHAGQMLQQHDPHGLWSRLDLLLGATDSAVRHCLYKPVMQWQLKLASLPFCVTVWRIGCCSSCWSHC
jgi:hypothetical protein